MANRKRTTGFILAALLVGCAAQAPSREPPRYLIRYTAELDPAAGTADVNLLLDQRDGVLRLLDFNVPADRFRDFSGDGELTRDADRLLWRPPAQGGSLSYTVTVNRRRDDAYDSLLTAEWGVFRLDRLFPAARARAVEGTTARATLRFTGPSGWRFETPYGPTSEPVHKVTSERLFPRPVGWAVAGRLGIRRDEIAGRRVAVAAPVGEGFRRQDTLAFLRWTLPALVEVFPTFPERLLVVGGSVDMWRGGLSGPGSLYLHPERPLISGNATSPLLHELVHVAIGSTPGMSDDWLVEGLAEYYSLELLRRTDGISQARFDAALEWLRGWVARDGGRLANPSTGPDTAYAALILQQLAESASRSGVSLDSVLNRLLSLGQLKGSTLRTVLEEEGIDTQLLDGQGTATTAQSHAPD